MTPHRPHATRNVGSRTTPAYIDACRQIAAIVSQARRDGCTRSEIDQRIRAARPMGWNKPGRGSWESARRKVMQSLREGERP